MAVDLNGLAAAISQLILRFRLRRALAAAWTSSNEVLLDAEMAVETNGGATSTWKVKIGDGVTPWNSLTYWSPGVFSVVAGTNVTVDNTDPKNPIINATGGGGSGSPSPDDIPTSPDAMDDEFDTTSLDLTKWTWQQQNTASAAVGRGSLVITSQLTSSNIPNAIEQTIPAGNCSFVVKGNALVGTSNNFAGMFHLRESATGKILAGGIFNNGGTIVAVTTNGTMGSGYSGLVTTIAAGVAAGASSVKMYWKLDISGTNIIFSLSADGLVYGVIATLARATYFTTAPDKIGLVTRGGASATSSFLIADYFRRIA